MLWVVCGNVGVCIVPEKGCFLAGGSGHVTPPAVTGGGGREPTDGVVAEGPEGHRRGSILRLASLETTKYRTPVP